MATCLKISGSFPELPCWPPMSKCAKGMITWRDDTVISYEFKGSCLRKSSDKNSRMNVYFRHPLELCVLILGSPCSSWRFMAIPERSWRTAGRCWPRPGAACHSLALLGTARRSWCSWAFPTAAPRQTLYFQTDFEKIN